jgi:hypothetical protein
MKLVSKREIRDVSGATSYLVNKITGQINAKAIGKYGSKLYEFEQIKKTAEKELKKPKIRLKTIDFLKRIIAWSNESFSESNNVKLTTYDGGKSSKYEGLTSKQKDLAIALGNLVKNFQELNNFLDQEDKELEEIL